MGRRLCGIFWDESGNCETVVLFVYRKVQGETVSFLGDAIRRLLGALPPSSNASVHLLVYCISSHSLALPILPSTSVGFGDD